MGRDTVKDFAKIGRALSRKTLDNLGGPDQFRTKIVQTPNGPARVRTHGGLPRSYPMGSSGRQDAIPPVASSFVAVPCSVEYPNGYAPPADPALPTDHVLRSWETTTLPPNTYVEGGKNALKPKEIESLPGNQTWFSDNVRIGAHRAVISWGGAPWRYGTYNSQPSNFGDAPNFYYQTFGWHNDQISPYHGDKNAWSINAPYRGIGKRVWLNEVEVPTTYDVWGAGVRVIGSEVYLYYVTRPSPGLYRLVRKALAATVTNGIAKLDAKGIHGFDQILGNLTWPDRAMPVLAGNPWPYVRTEMVQHPYFNASCTKFAGVAGEEYEASRYSMHSFSYEVDVDTILLTKIHSDWVFHEKSGRTGSTTISSSGPSKPSTYTEAYSLSGSGYELWRETGVLFADYNGDALVAAKAEYEKRVDAPFTSSASLSKVTTVNVSSSLSGTIRTTVTTKTTSISETRAHSAVGQVSYTLRVLTNTGVELAKITRQGERDALSSAELSATGTTVSTSVVDEGNGGQLISFTVDESPGNFTRNVSNSEQHSDDAGYRAMVSGDVRSDSFSLFLLINTYTLDFTDQSSTPGIVRGSGNVTYYNGTSSYNWETTYGGPLGFTSKFFGQTKETFEYDRVITDVDTGSGSTLATGPKFNYSTSVVDHSLPPYLRDEPTTALIQFGYQPKNSLGHNEPAIGVIANSIAYGKYNDTEVVYHHFKVTGLGASPPVDFQGFARKTPTGVEIQSCSAKDYAPASELRTLGNPVFLPKKV